MIQPWDENATLADVILAMWPCGSCGEARAWHVFNSTGTGSLYCRDPMWSAPHASNVAYFPERPSLFPSPVEIRQKREFRR